MKNLKKISLLTLIVFTLSILGSSFSPVFATDNTINKNDTYEIGQVYNGFKLIEEGGMPNYNATGRLFVHEKTGATLFQFKNADPNKFFSITFKTPVDNNEGTPHVFEHALLTGGSKKYPIKQLVFKIMNGSVANYMNGLTYSDKTVYPFSTTSEKEFKNFIDVYLDMAFNAQIETSENIFKEEAWHYEIKDVNDPLTRTGVVLSEMKGNANSATRKLSLSINQSLFPNTTYSYNTGGDPKEIPNLTYEEVVAFYKKYYTPKNSFIFIYGDTPLNDKLKLINDEFLSKIPSDRIGEKVVLPKTTPFNKPVEYEDVYAIPANTPIENKDFLTVNYVIGDSANMDTIYPPYILNQLIFNNPNSSFQKTMIEAGFPTVSCQLSFSQVQATMSFVSANTDRNKKNLFVKTLNTAIKNILKEGIDNELLESTINNYELTDKLGKAYTSATANNIFWLASLGATYDENIINLFNSEKSAFEKVKNSPNTTYFQDFLKNKILNNNYHSIVTLKAVAGLSEKEAMEEATELSKLKTSLGEEKVKELVKQYNDLVTWRNTPESMEVLSKLPILDTNTLTPEIILAPTEIKRINGIKVLHHPMNTNGTNGIKLIFKTNQIEQNKIQYITLLSQILSELDTEKCTNQKIQNLELKYTNGLSYSTSIITENHKNVYTPVFTVSTKSLNENLTNVLGLMNETLIYAKIDDKEKLKTIIEKIKTSLDLNLSNNLISYGIKKNMAKESNYMAYLDQVKGVEYYKFIQNLYNNFDKDYDSIVKNLSDVYKDTINLNNLTVSITIDSKDYPKFEDKFSTFITHINNDRKKFAKSNPEKVPNVNVLAKLYTFDNKKFDNAFTANAQINYNLITFNSKDLGFSLDPTNPVIKSIVNDYLFNAIRVKGKAYGAGIFSSNDGLVTFYTYRDPRVKDSYEDFKGVANYLRNSNNYYYQLNQYKLDALKGYYTPKSVYDLASAADSYYFAGISEIDLLKNLDNILNINLLDIISYGDLFETGIKNATKTTVGNKSLIENDKNIFDEITEITE